MDTCKAQQPRRPYTECTRPVGHEGDHRDGTLDRWWAQDDPVPALMGLLDGAQ